MRTTVALPGSTCQRGVSTLQSTQGADRSRMGCLAIRSLGRLRRHGLCVVWCLFGYGRLSAFCVRALPAWRCGRRCGSHPNRSWYLGWRRRRSAGIGFSHAGAWHHFCGGAVMVELSSRRPLGMLFPVGLCPRRAAPELFFPFSDSTIGDARLFRIIQKRRSK